MREGEGGREGAVGLGWGEGEGEEGGRGHLGDAPVLLDRDEVGVRPLAVQVVEGLALLLRVRGRGGGRGRGRGRRRVVRGRRAPWG